MKFDWKKLRTNTLGGILLHLFLALGIIVVLAVLYFYAYLPSATNHGETITVPNIEGKSMEEVQVFLAKHDLRFEVSDSAYSADYPPLTVLKQYPSAGSKVKENRKIYLSINRINPPTVPLPTGLVGHSVVNAVALLKASELKLGRIELVAGPFNIVKNMKYRGAVISEDSRVPKGSVIDMVVMDGGSKQFDSPTLVGQPFEDAKFLILGSNLSLGEVTLVGDTTGGTAIVIKQHPEASTVLNVGDVIDIWLGQPGAVVPDEEEEGDPEDEEIDQK